MKSRTFNTAIKDSFDSFCHRTTQYLRQARGFTLVEILVVIVIISILATLVLSVASKMRNSADLAKCASNLRQISAGIQCYIGDNDGYLPGPLVNGCCYPGYRKQTGDGQLGSLLAPYLGQKTPTNLAWYQLDIFVCPAWKRKINPAAPRGNWAPIYPAPVYTRPTNTAIGGVNPFGYPNLTPPQNPRTASIMSGHASTYPIIIDADQKNYNGNTNLPPEPAHGNIRNTLFFDGHVEATPVTP